MPRFAANLAYLFTERPLIERFGAAAAAGFSAEPPGNRREKLKGDRAGQWSIRVNHQWRICFLWKEDGAHEVEVVDYH
jgi:proteic killer suppression protein